MLYSFRTRRNSWWLIPSTFLTSTYHCSTHAASPRRFDTWPTNITRDFAQGPRLLCPQVVEKRWEAVFQGPWLGITGRQASDLNIGVCWHVRFAKNKQLTVPYKIWESFPCVNKNKYWSCAPLEALVTTQQRWAICQGVSRHIGRISILDTTNATVSWIDLYHFISMLYRNDTHPHTNMIVIYNATSTHLYLCQFVCIFFSTSGRVLGCHKSTTEYMFNKPTLPLLTSWCTNTLCPVKCAWKSAKIYNKKPSADTVTWSLFHSVDCQRI